jgi:hypothetical protein
MSTYCFVSTVYLLIPFQREEKAERTLFFKWGTQFSAVNVLWQGPLVLVVHTHWTEGEALGSE